MKTETIIRKSLDLTEKGVDLAKLIYEMAEECDTTNTFSRSIDLNGFLDDMTLHIEILNIQHKNQHISEEKRQKLVDATIAEYEQTKAKAAAEKETKRKKVKQYINDNAEEAYKLAYKLCREDASDDAKKLAYRMIHQLKDVTIEEKIEICFLYAETLKDGNEIAKVYCQMAGLVYPASKRIDYSLCLSFYEKAYDHINQPTRMLDEIVGFCNRFQIDELRLKCLQKKEVLQAIKEDKKNSYK